MYSDIIMEHFINPRNIGIIEDADGIGTLGDPDCGDFIKVFIKVTNDCITDIKFQIVGCPAAIACGSAMTEISMGKTIDEAYEIVDDTIIDYLGGLPEEKAHCSNLGAGALHRAIYDYILKSFKKDGHVMVTVVE
ncbi:MAG: nitrogen fixation protein NifU [Peptococcaceae bacterium BICA1-8]|nr:MAG: nitrogen fixation protein NifU [Peptococcaceae bacterium BICA1-8]